MQKREVNKDMMSRYFLDENLTKLIIPLIILSFLTISIVTNIRIGIVRGQSLQNGDINGDGVINLKDLVLLTQAYGSKLGDKNWNPKADLDGDGVIGNGDLLILKTNYGQGLPMTVISSTNNLRSDGVSGNPDPVTFTDIVEHGIECIISYRTELPAYNSPTSTTINETNWYNETMTRTGNAYNGSIWAYSYASDNHYLTHYIITAINIFGNTTEIAEGFFNWWGDP